MIIIIIIIIIIIVISKALFRPDPKYHPHFQTLKF